MQVGTSAKGLGWLLASMALVLLVIIALSQYATAAINTRFYLDDIAEVKEFCRLGEMPVEDVKLVEYDRRKGEVRLYCLYADKRANREIIASRIDDSWVKSREELMSTPGKRVWPLYF